MGYILSGDDERPDCDGLGIEVRSESFYLYGMPTVEGGDDKARIFVYRNTFPDDGTGTVEFELKDIPKIRAALDAIEAYRLRRSRRKP